MTFTLYLSIFDTMTLQGCSCVGLTGKALVPQMPEPLLPVLLRSPHLSLHRLFSLLLFRHCAHEQLAFGSLREGHLAAYPVDLLIGVVCQVSISCSRKALACAKVSATRLTHLIPAALKRRIFASLYTPLSAT
jgi:hypothetical protein